MRWGIRQDPTCGTIDVYKRQTTYRGKHRNMKPNSNGSVTPQTKAQIAAETTRPIAAFLFFAVRTIASAAPGIPNSMQGKKPVSYTHLDVYKRQIWHHKK